jgi:hypothetical protein
VVEHPDAVVAVARGIEIGVGMGGNGIDAFEDVVEFVAPKCGKTMVASGYFWIVFSISSNSVWTSNRGGKWQAKPGVAPKNR